MNLKQSDRPRIEIMPSRLDKVLDGVSAAGVLLMISLLVAVWSRLPARVATHFALSGEPDGWGSRSSLLLFAIAPLVIHVGLTFVARMPWSFNYPVKVTEENAERLYTLGRRCIEWLRTEIVLLLVVLGVQTIRVALKHAEGVGAAIVFVPLVAVYATIGYYVVSMYRARGG